MYGTVYFLCHVYLLLYVLWMYVSNAMISPEDFFSSILYNFKNPENADPLSSDSAMSCVSNQGIKWFLTAVKSRLNFQRCKRCDKLLEFSKACDKQMNHHQESLTTQYTWNSVGYLSLKSEIYKPKQLKMLLVKTPAWYVTSGFSGSASGHLQPRCRILDLLFSHR